MYTRPFQSFVASQNTSRLHCNLPFKPCKPGRRANVVSASVSAVEANTASVAAAEQHVVADVDRRDAFQLETAAVQTGSAVELKWWEVDCPDNMRNISDLQDLVHAVAAEACPSTGRLVVVNFFAPECYACKSLQPKLRQIARNNPDVLFLKVNGLQGNLQGYCEDMGITRIPYFHFYRANKRVAEFTANMRPEKLALLRAEIAAHKTQAIKTADTPQYAALEA